MGHFPQSQLLRDLRGLVLIGCLLFALTPTSCGPQLAQEPGAEPATKPESATKPEPVGPESLAEPADSQPQDASTEPQREPSPQDASDEPPGREPPENKAEGTPPKEGPPEATAEGPPEGRPQEKGPQEKGPHENSPETTREAPSPRARRVVLAGDSWSTGLITPTQQAFKARGFSQLSLSYKTTARAGSQAEGWVADRHPPKAGGGVDTTQPRMLTALKQSLDASPKADVLLLVIGGNDYNREATNGLGQLPKALQALRYDKIQKDIQSLVNTARTGRPHLKIVLLGYDYLHFEYLVAFGLKLKGYTRETYNQGLIELARRKRAIAKATPNVEYAHNLGILQYTYGDKIHPPFPAPNPLPQFGCVPYAPKTAPKPGFAPGYKPFPGGLPGCPAPLDYMPDGIHPNPTGFRTIIDNTLDQGLERWLQGKSWH